MDLRGSADASAASLDEDSGRGSKNEGEGLPSGKANTSEDITGAELHFDINSEDLNDAKESTLHNQVNIAP